MPTAADQRANDHERTEDEVDLQAYLLRSAPHIRISGKAHQQISRKGIEGAEHVGIRDPQYEHDDERYAEYEHEQVDDDQLGKPALEYIPEQCPTVGRQCAARVFLVALFAFEHAGYETFLFALRHNTSVLAERFFVCYISL